MDCWNLPTLCRRTNGKEFYCEFRAIIINCFLQFSCAAHTLDLVAKKDFNTALSESKFKVINRLHVNTYSKCKQIWNGINRPQHSEAIQKLLDHQLPYPVVTRWGTDYKCIKALVKEEEIEPGMLKKLLAITKTEAKDYTEFNDREVQYLRDYLKLMGPLANGIDNLQGDAETFYGDLLPTLYTIKAELEDLSKLDLIGGLADVLLKSIVEKRFAKEFQLEESAKMAICAAISHPAYKSKWGSVADSEKALKVFKKEFDDIASKMTPNIDDQENCKDQQKFIRLRPTAITSEASEMNRYLLSERVDLKMLDDFPVVREMFFKFNTQLPSSASVERMFNFAGILDDPKRGRILPSNFENNVVLKANSVFGRKK